MAYIRNSAVCGGRKHDTPLLIEVAMATERSILHQGRCNYNNRTPGRGRSCVGLSMP